LSQEGLAKTLAEPTLVALSGQEAEFHAGGEVPILSSSSMGQVNVEYKKFGVQLSFTPTVLSERTLSLKLGIEVSEIDASAGVVLAGFQVPGFKNRSSDTTLRLKDGQSFAIAGLLSDEMRAVSSKIPVLGSLPILGLLFSSKSYQRNETELLMVVTAHLVKPLTPSEVPAIPGEDEFNDPNDFELFLLGIIESEQDQPDEKNKTEASVSERQFSKRNSLIDIASELNTEPTQKNHSLTQTPEQPGSPSTTPAPPTQNDKPSTLEGPLGPLGFVRS